MPVRLLSGSWPPRAVRTDRENPRPFEETPHSGRREAVRSSRNSHAFENVQSRSTVSDDICSTLAISSAVRPPKKRELAAASLALAHGGERLQGIVQRDEVPPRLVREEQRLVERDSCCATASFLVALGASHIDQDSPHLPRRHREEVRTVLPGHPFRVSIEDEGRPR